MCVLLEKKITVEIAFLNALFKLASERVLRNSSILLLRVNDLYSL